jgi:hypothetical protein
MLSNCARLAGNCSSRLHNSSYLTPARCSHGSGPADPRGVSVSIGHCIPASSSSSPCTHSQEIAQAPRGGRPPGIPPARPPKIAIPSPHPSKIKRC